MNVADRELSSFLAIKGPLVEETYRAFGNWDLSVPARQNLKVIRDTNCIGASSAGWLTNVCKVINRRYDFDGRDRRLVELVRFGWHIDDWRPVQLWHICQNDVLLRSFLGDWLFEERERGVVLVGAEAVEDFLRSATSARLRPDEAWSEATMSRATSGLLKAAVEFGLLRGRTTKEFAAYRLPEQSFIYLLYAMMENEKSTKNMIHSRDWRLFFLGPHQVEEELLRLHQFGKLRFERAGSFLELTLPCPDTSAYVRSLAG